MTTLLCAGVAVIDIVFGLDEMPRRAEKYRAADAWISGGGNAANAAVAASRLGHTARLAARLGDDAIADMIVSGLEADGVDCHLVRRFAGRKSSFSSVFVDAKGDRQIVNYRDMGISFDTGWLETADLGDFDVALADTRWPQCGAVLLKRARERGAPAVLDVEAPVELALPSMEQATHLAFSARGLKDFSGVQDLTHGLRMAAARFKTWVAVTDGAYGVYWLDNDTVRHLPAFEIEPVETLGAGDVWHGVFAIGLGENMPVETAIMRANAAAAIKCSRSGGRAGYPTNAEIEAFLVERA